MSGGPSATGSVEADAEVLAFSVSLVFLLLIMESPLDI